MPSMLRKLGGAPHWSKGEDPAFVDHVKAIRPLIDNFKEIVKLLKKYHITFRESVTTYGAKCSTQLVGLQSVDSGWEHLSRLGELFGSECNVMKESIDGATGQGLLIPLESFLNTELQQAHAKKTRFRQDKLTHHQKKAAHEKANRKEAGGVKASQASTEESIAENELKKSRAELEKQLEEVDRGRIRFAKVVTDYTDLRLASLEKSIQTLADTRSKIKTMSQGLPVVEDKPLPPGRSPRPPQRKEVQHVPPSRVAATPIKFFSGESEQLDRLPKPMVTATPPGDSSALLEKTPEDEENATYAHDEDDDNSDTPADSPAGGVAGGPPPPPMAATNPGAAGRLPPGPPGRKRPPITGFGRSASGIPFPTRMNGVGAASSRHRLGRVQTSFTPPLPPRKLGDTPRRSSTSSMRTSVDVIADGPPSGTPPRAPARAGSPPPLLSQHLRSGSQLGPAQPMSRSGPQSMPRSRTRQRSKIIPSRGPPPSSSTGARGPPPAGPPATSSTGARGPPPAGPRAPRGSLPVPNITALNASRGSPPNPATAFGASRGPPPIPGTAALGASRGPPPVPITTISASRGPPPIPAIATLGGPRPPPPSYMS